MTYEYTIEKPKELGTKITTPEQYETFVIAQMNLIGLKGGVILGNPIEFQDPTSITDSQGRNIMNFGVILFVRYEVTETGEPVTSA